MGDFPAIDAVYLWVDGADPHHVASRHAHLGYGTLARAQGMRPYRFRDCGELRLSLRLLHRHAPWINRIFIVTDGQAPPWLDKDDPRIAIIDHDQILPPEMRRPCFNSLAIECHLHRIPGLAEHFIYFNDDFLIGRPVSQADFLNKDGTERLFTEATNSRLTRLTTRFIVLERHHELLRRILFIYRRISEATSMDIHRRILNWNMILLTLTFGYRWAWIVPAHAPQLLTRAGFATLERRFGRAMRRTARHRMRRWLSAFPVLLYDNNRLTELGRPAVRPLEAEDYAFVSLDPRDTAACRRLTDLMASPPTFICVNDDRDDEKENMELTRTYDAFRDALAPEPAPWERPEPEPRPVALVFEAPFAAPGGAECVGAWIIEALRRDYRVVVLAWDGYDPAALDRQFGTHIAGSDVKIVRVARRWGRHLSRLLPLTSRPHLRLMLRHARLLHRDLRPDLVVSTRGGIDVPQRAIQYHHHPCPVLGKLGASRPWYLSALARVWRAFTDRLHTIDGPRVRDNLTLTNSSWTAARVDVPATVVRPPAPVAIGTTPWEDRENCFVCLGRFYPEKRIERAIEILSAVRARGRPVTLRIVGVPDSRPYSRLLRRLARQAGPWVSLHENLPRTELEALLGRCRFGLHLMEDEHYGIAVAEMVRAGCMPFISQSGGAPEIVGFEPALQFRDEVHAVERIMAVLEDDQECLRLRRALAVQAKMLGPEPFTAQIRAIAASFLEAGAGGPSR